MRPTIHPGYECANDTCDAFPYTTPEAAAACLHTRPGEPIRKAGQPVVGRSHLGDMAPAATPTPTSSGRFEVVDNGFGGTTTRKVATTPAAAEPTDKQKDYVRRLLAERAGVAQAEIVRARLNLARVNGTLDRRTVSRAIDDLLAIKVLVATDTRSSRKVESEGRVTIDKEALPVPARGVLRFAVMSETADLTFLAFKYRGDDIIVCQEIGGRGDDTYVGRQNAGQVYRGRLARLVAKVMADPMEAMLTYGREIGRCGHCGTKLTNKKSRDLGIGPVCATK